MKYNENNQQIKSHIIIAKAEDFENAKNITMQLKSSFPVLFVTQTSDTNEKQRILDFITGAAFVLDLAIKKVSSEVFLVALSDSIEELWNAYETYDLYNQSTLSRSDR